MSSIDYKAMSDHKLKQYFFRNRDDKEALQVYLDRINQHPHEVITTVDAPDFNKRIQAAVEKKRQGDISEDRFQR